MRIADIKLGHRLAYYYDLYHHSRVHIAQVIEIKPGLLTVYDNDNSKNVYLPFDINKGSVAELAPLKEESLHKGFITQFDVDDSYYAN